VSLFRAQLKQWFYQLLGKDPDAVVVTFATGDADLCRRMAEEIRELVPDRRHFFVTEANWPELRIELQRYRIGLVPVMLTPQPSALRRAAYKLAPRKILAYNSRFERHHLRPTLASFLFWRGVPLDRILSAPVVVALAQARPHPRHQGLSRHRRPRHLARAPPRGRALSLFPLPALARRRRAHLQPAARDGARVRCRAALLLRHR
jgi:hypothetical protein